MCESPLQKCFGAKLCILVSGICICGSPKTDATFGDDFKRRVSKIFFASSNVGGNNVKSVCTKLHCALRPVEGCSCASLPCQSVLGLNCVYLCLLFVFLGHQKQMQLLAMISKGGFKNILCIKQGGWEQCEVALHKVALRMRPVEGCSCASLPCQSVLGLNYVYLCLLFVFLGHQNRCNFWR